MASLETIEQMFHDNRRLSEVEHNAILSKIQHFEERFSEKICIQDEKIKELEEGYDEFKAWKSYAIVVVAFLSLFAPYLISLLFKIILPN